MMWGFQICEPIPAHGGQLLKPLGESFYFQHLVPRRWQVHPSLLLCPAAPQGWGASRSWWDERVLPKCGDMQDKEGDTAASRERDTEGNSWLGAAGLPALPGWYKVFWYLNCGLQQDVCVRMSSWQHPSRSKISQQSTAVLRRFGFKSAQSSSHQAAACCWLGSSFALQCLPSQFSATGGLCQVL